MDYAGARWARAMVGAVNAREDLRTVAAWGDAISVAPSTLRNWCRTAGLSPKRSLSLARLLRALALSHGTKWRPEQRLDVVDLRTLARLLELGGIRGPTPPTFVAFLQGQTLITDPEALQALRTALTP